MMYVHKTLAHKQTTPRHDCFYWDFKKKGYEIQYQYIPHCKVWRQVRGDVTWRGHYDTFSFWEFHHCAFECSPPHNLTNFSCISWFLSPYMSEGLKTLNPYFEWTSPDWEQSQFKLFTVPSEVLGPVSLRWQQGFSWNYFVNMIVLHFKHREIFITRDYKPQTVDSLEQPVIFSSETPLLHEHFSFSVFRCKKKKKYNQRLLKVFGCALCRHAIL